MGLWGSILQDSNSIGKSPGGIHIFPYLKYQMYGVGEEGEKLKC